MNDLISRQEALDAIIELCKHYTPTKSVDHPHMDFVLETIKGLPSVEPQWILCSERLPEDDRSKVVTLANGNAEVGYYSNGDWWCVGDNVTLENQTVIAWMPLPEPYKGDKK